MYRDSEDTIKSISQPPHTQPLALTAPHNFNGGLNHYYTKNNLHTLNFTPNDDPFQFNTLQHKPILRFNMTSWTWLVTENSEIGTPLKNAKTGANVVLKIKDRLEFEPENFENSSLQDLEKSSIRFYLEYGQVTTPDNAKIKINELTGEVTVNNNFDYEKSKQHTYIVKASNGQYNITSRAKIFVIDENDFTPTFSKKVYNFIVSENVQPGSNIGQVFAIDKDTGFGGKIKYTVEGKDADYVEIDAINGTVYLKKSLDYEGNKKRLTFIVKAEDSMPLIMAPLKEPLSSTARGIITIVDSPDSLPIWTDTTQISIKIPEDTKPGTKIGQLTAIDGDRGSSEADIFYRVLPYPTPGVLPLPMIQNPENYYESPIDIEITTGEIFLMEGLDFENPDQRNTIATIEAYEGVYEEGADPEIDAPVASNIIARTMLIQLLDVNDNQPKFNLTHYEINVHSDIFTKGGQIHLPVSVEDIDAYPFNEAIVVQDKNSQKISKIEEEKIRGRQQGFELKIQATDIETLYQFLDHENVFNIYLNVYESNNLVDVANTCQIKLRISDLQNFSTQLVTEKISSTTQTEIITEPIMEITVGTTPSVFEAPKVVEILPAQLNLSPTYKPMTYHKPEIFVNSNQMSLIENEIMDTIQFSIYDDDEDFYTQPEGSGDFSQGMNHNHPKSHLPMEMEDIVSLTGEFASHFTYQFDEYEENKINLIQVKPFDYEQYQEIVLYFKVCDHRRYCDVETLKFMILPVNEHAPTQPEGLDSEIEIKPDQVGQEVYLGSVKSDDHDLSSGKLREAMHQIFFIRLPL